MPGDACRASWPANWPTGCEAAMTGPIFPLRGDTHAQVQSRLPWFVTDRLDSSDKALVEAPLDKCGECCSAASVERRLREKVRDLPVDVERGWALMDARLDAPPPRRNRNRQQAPRLGRDRRSLGGRPPGWVMAAQAAAVAAVLGLAFRPAAPPAAQRAPGSAPAVAAGKLLAIFRPETPESDLRAALQDGHARLSDGPSAAGAYVLHVAPKDMAQALETLRGRRGVVLAEPIDGGPTQG